MTILSPEAQAIWDAFNQDEPGVFVDYGDCLASALRALAEVAGREYETYCIDNVVDVEDIYRIANELEGAV